MKKGENFNHPQKGSSTKVEPIRSLKDIATIKRLLSDNPRDFCIFVVGINTNLRASDLLQITVKQVRDLKPDDEISLKERKTSKNRRINLNAGCIEAIQNLLKSRNYQPDDYLFVGQRGRLSVPTINRMVKNLCAAVNLKGNYGSHSLRKTFGYHQRRTFKVGISELMTVFNHSTQKQTLNYLCVQPDEIKAVYKNQL